MNEFVEGDTGSALSVTCTDTTTGAVINLTGSTVALKWESATGAVVTRAMTVSSPASGVALYQFATGELYPTGMQFEVVITDSGGKLLSNIEFITVNVRAKLS